MLFTCLMTSLSSSGKAKLNIHDKYLIGDPPIESGLCLLKILIRESHLDSIATSSMIRTELSNLDKNLTETNNDILKFNNHGRMLIDSLTTRGKTTQDLLTNLFTAYAACSDSAFVKYVAGMQTKWEDGEELTPEKLMDRVSNKYKIMKTKEVWNAPSAEQKTLGALEAKISDLKKKYENKKAKLDQSKKRESNKREGNKAKNTETRNQKRTKVQKPAWMFQRSKDADLRKPSVSGTAPHGTIVRQRRVKSATEYTVYTNHPSAGQGNKIKETVANGRAYNLADDEGDNKP